ncbi:FxDxF family PEP-CTERM protein [Paucibacter sp. R3-3]|uniref:FxDxF family PEP-CTERM protein n=1 Tax=Roseateles agri TaxID=3098619 RepID=A0ABU5DIN6_9BURK|nr:FxDxF family PEP-CTERM protein [Paucibacter sp. R3-3]MDY0746167.1 FxDxF family PEP-CTERM protein [Paucibacter sp. R3-3]
MKQLFLLKAVFASAVIASALLGGNASATTYNLGAVSIGVPKTFSATVANGIFADTYTFALPTNGGSGYSFQNFPIDLGSLGTLNLSFSGFDLAYAGADGVVGNADDKVVASGNLSSVGSYSFSVPATEGGVYYLDIFGRATGSLGGAYNGAISVQAVSPVPEPGSYVMLMAGLGAVGLVATRRRRTLR